MRFGQGLGPGAGGSFNHYLALGYKVGRLKPRHIFRYLHIVSALTWFLVLKIHRLLRSIIATLLEVQVAISYRFVKIIWVIFSVKLHFGRLCKLLQTPDVLVTSNLFQKSVKWQIIQNNHPLGVIICRCRLFHFFCRLL